MSNAFRIVKKDLFQADLLSTQLRLMKPEIG